MCGFVQSTFVSTPFTTKVLLPSNSAEKEWCASAGTVAASIATTDSATPQPLRPIIVTSSPAWQPQELCARNCDAVSADLSRCHATTARPCAGGAPEAVTADDDRPALQGGEPEVADV